MGACVCKDKTAEAAFTQTDESDSYSHGGQGHRHRDGNCQNNYTNIAEQSDRRHHSQPPSRSHSSHQVSDRCPFVHKLRIISESGIKYPQI